MRQQGFTLSEVLVSVTIFMIVGSAMVGIFATSVELYRSGERGRSANDEAMAVISRLDADLARAIPANQGGHVYARAGNAGFDIFGILIQSEDSPSQRDFVVWQASGSGPRRTLTRNVHRNVSESVLINMRQRKDGPNSGANRVINAPDITAVGDTISDGCLHFGAWLLGTGDSSQLNDRYTIPGDRYWSDADPIDTVYSSIPNSLHTVGYYPSAVRISLIIDGARIPRATLRLRQELGPARDQFGQLIPGQRVHLVGAGEAPSMAGSVVRIGDELIGYHRADNKILTINSDTNPDLLHGPVRWTQEDGYGNGRGIYRSRSPLPSQIPPHTHARGTPVYFGHSFTVIRLLP